MTTMRQRLSAHWGWVVVTTTWLLMLALQGVIMSFGIFFVEFQADFDSSTTLIGWVGCIPLALVRLLALPIVLAVERFGHRVVCIVGVVLECSGILLTSFMPYLPPMLVTYSLILGVGTAIIGLAPVSLIIKYFPSKNCVRASSLAISGGNAVDSKRGTAWDAEKEHSWSETRPSNGRKLSPDDDSSLTSSPVIISDDLSRKEQEADLLEEGPSKTAAVDGEWTQATLLSGLRVVATYPELWMLSLAVLLSGVGECFYIVNLVSFMVSAGFTETQGSQILSIVGVSSLFGKLLLSFGGELVPFPTVFSMLITALINCGVMICLPLAKTMLFMYIIGGVIGCMVGMTTGLIFTLPQRFFGPGRAEAVWPVILSSNGIGYILSSISGQSLDGSGSYLGAIRIFTGMHLLVAFLLVMAPTYQKIFAKDRYVMMEQHRQQRQPEKRVQTSEKDCPVDSKLLNGESNMESLV
ncbi:monocarboxylate transporter 13-like [Diadema antillarum]|uniref:monocarboxylate transporter 13-like n=1 Tax=Diadema antillarum TaxID=105358 RepID=UPI003A8AAA76